MNKNREELYEKIIFKMFKDKVPDGYKLKNYYSVMMMGMKKYKGKYVIRLQYGYKGRNPVNSDPVEIDDLGKALKLYGLLSEFSLNEIGSKNDEEQDLLDQI